MEQIKRANKIWTNDSVFMKEHLLIPLPLIPRQEDGSSLENGSAFPSRTSPYPSGQIVSKQDLQNANRMSRSRSSDSVAKDKQTLRRDFSPPAKDFLKKFDNSLNQIRSSIQRLEQTTE